MGLQVVSLQAESLFLLLLITVLLSTGTTINLLRPHPVLSNMYDVSVWEEKNVLEREDNDSCTKI